MQRAGVGICPDFQLSVTKPRKGRKNRIMKTTILCAAPAVKLTTHEFATIDDIKHGRPEEFYLEWDGWASKNLASHLDECLKEMRSYGAAKIQEPCYYVAQQGSIVRYLGFDPGFEPGWLLDSQQNRSFEPIKKAEIIAL